MHKLTLIALTALSLFACGGDDASEEVNAATSNTATSNAAPDIRVDGVVAATTTSGSVRYRARSSSGSSARWYVGTNRAGRLPTGAPTEAYLAEQFGESELPRSPLRIQGRPRSGPVIQ